MMRHRLHLLVLAPFLLVACATPTGPGEDTGQRVVRGADGRDVVLQTRAPFFPPITVRDLEGREVSLPRALPAPRSVVIVAFERDQADALAAWVAAMGYETARTLPWVGIAAPPPGLEFIEGAITAQLAANVPGRADRRRIYTYYDRNRLLAGLQVRTASAPVIVVATRDGDVVTLVRGAPNAEKVKRLKAALR